MSFGAVLLVGAYTSARFTPRSVEGAPPGAQDTVPSTIIDGGAIVDTTQGQARSYALPAKTIALTFDDGPSAQWTPAVLSVLGKYGVTATFFVLGEQATEEPGIMRTLVEEGHEIGIHTFTHPDLSQLDNWRMEFELSLTQLAIVGTTGRTTTLLREPYSSGASSVDNASWDVIQAAGEFGYLTVVSDKDSRDWDETDVATMVRNATPADDAGAVVLWHDAGGDRTNTIAALDTYISTMLDAGYQFTTVSAGLSLAIASTETTVSGSIGMAQASQSVIVRGLLVVWVIQATEICFKLLWILFIVVGVLTVGRTLAMFLFALHHVTERRGKHWSWGHPVRDPVSVVVPAYNESKGIAEAVRSLANGDHPVIEVIVVDDGSTDDTAVVVESLNLPNVRVIRTRNRGKPAALNLGVTWASHDIIVMVDGDTIFEKQSIRMLVQPLASTEVGAVAGNVKIGNRATMVARFQHLEYVIGFNLDRRFYDTLHCMPTVPGAIGAFRRSAIVDVGGISGETLAEDTDLTMAICRAGWHVVYEEKARAWTEAPTTIRQLWKQRYRWSYGTMQAMWKHKRAIFEHSPFGLVGLPMLAVFGVILPLFAPLFDILALYGALVLDSDETVLAWLAMLAIQAVTAIVAFLLDGECLLPLWTLPFQQLIYRQTMYLVAIHSAITAFTGARLRWQKLHRTGLISPKGHTVTPHWE